MAIRDTERVGADGLGGGEPAAQTKIAPTAQLEGGMDATPPSPEAGGSQAPPPDAGDSAPGPEFPVPPVPPPPTPGPIFNLAGSGDGGPASYARPGTSAARPFRSPVFTANRSTAAPGGAALRFGSGTAVAAGGGSSPSFLPAGLDGGEAGPGQGRPDEELRKIMAVLQGGGGGRF